MADLAILEEQEKAKDIEEEESEAEDEDENEETEEESLLYDAMVLLGFLAQEQRVTARDQTSMMTMAEKIHELLVENGVIEESDE